YLYKLFFDTLSKGVRFDPQGKHLIALITVIALFHILRNVFRRVGDYNNIGLYTNVMTEMASHTFDTLHRHSYSFFTNQFAGALVKKANRLIMAFELISDKVYYELAPLTLSVSVMFAVLTYLNPWIGLAMAAWTTLFIVFSYKFTLYKWKFDVERSEADTALSANLSDTVVNNVNLKLFSSLSSENTRNTALLGDWRQKMARAWKLSFYSDAIQGFMMALLEFIVFYLAIGQWVQGRLTLGDFIWIQTYLLQLFMSLWSVGRTIRDIFSRMADAQEMIEILDTPHEIQDAPHAKTLHVSDGKIEFRHVSFTYKKGEPVIRDFDLSIKPGEKVALIGPSGGGKSTITKLLLRFFDPQKGQILIDGQEIQKVTQDSLRSHVGYVPQDPILFHRPLMENIRYGNLKATDKAVIEAAKLAHCHEFIEQFPEKYDTFVGERGIRLSGGERQRVAIARAILANTPILILDEATSSLDSESESLIQQALENLIQQKTCLVIAHRLSTIMKMDRIVVLQSGQIVEQGTHADLLSKNASLYKRLWDLQVGGYLSMSNL
ncbi:ABC transporter ATP-binding protein, partial [Candidatus Peregrinibacteria bacterium]|nr:ABC transporter ATP-binding protein [Candidatus Peregrinibacteria bacterium]